MYRFRNLSELGQVKPQKETEPPASLSPHKVFDSVSSMFFLKSWTYNIGLMMAEELLFYCSEIFHI